MREIKFRAWDVEEEEMISNKSVFLHDGKLVAFRVNKPEKVRVTEYPALKKTVVDVTDLVKNIKISHENLTYLENMEVMQFTGLKDKNGKEIYEGDIVRVKNPRAFKGGDFYNSIGSVFWSEGAWYHGNDCGRPPKRMWQYCEVIGNIYENPEMIK